MLPGPPELEERYRRFLDGRGDDVVPLLRSLGNGRPARAEAEAWAALILSRIYILRGESDLALAFLRISSTRARGAGSLALRLGIRVNRALVVKQRGRIDEAAGELRAVAGAALRAGEQGVAAKAAANAALCLARIGRLDEARSYAGLAERIHDATGNGEGLARIALIGALIDERAGRMEEAIDRLSRLVRECGGAERERERLIGLLMLADIRLSAGDFDHAAAALAQAGAMAEALDAFPPQRRRLEDLRERMNRRAGLDAAPLARETPAAGAVVVPGEIRGRGRTAAARGSPGGALTEEAFVAVDPRTIRLLDRIRRAAPLDVPVLLRGESGTGKDLLARLIHSWSGRSGEPFVPVNAAAIPAELFEGTLWGHARGAFTGALCARSGLAGAAGSGTLFLDEIGELPPPLQAKLLRLVDRGEYYPLGESVPRRCEARLVFATNRDLAAARAEGSFRNDLYHRIAIVSFTVPPLRERRSDIAAIAVRLLDRLRARFALETPGLDEGALAALSAYDWPGNVRELEGELLRASLEARGRPIRAAHLSPAIAIQGRAVEPAAGDLRSRERSIRRERIVTALHEHGGNRTRAALALGVGRTTLIGMMKRLGIP